MLVLPAETRAEVECGDRQPVQYRIPTATASRPRDTWATLDSLLIILADELLIRDITEPSAVLGSLSGHDLQATYDHILEQFALELLIDRRSRELGLVQRQARHRRQPRPHSSPPSRLLRCQARSAATPHSD